MKHRWIVLVIVVVLAVACGVPVEPGDATLADGVESLSRDTAPPAEPASPLVEPASPVSIPPTPQLDREEDKSIADDLLPLVAKELNVAKDALKLVSAERITWRDASLGCPQEGMMYAQVVTPGWRVVYEDAGGTTFAVHTAENPEQFVVCQQATGEAKPGDSELAQSPPAVQAAVKLVAERQEVAVEAVSVIRADAVEWRNSCLGCQAPGQMCLTVITPGYLIVLESGGETVEVHTDSTGNTAIICENPPISPVSTDR